MELARKYLVNAEEVRDKLLELPTLVESKEVDGCGCVPGRWEVHDYAE